MQAECETANEAIETAAALARWRLPSPALRRLVCRNRCVSYAVTKVSHMHAARRLVTADAGNGRRGKRALEARLGRIDAALDRAGYQVQDGGDGHHQGGSESQHVRRKVCKGDALVALDVRGGGCERARVPVADAAALIYIHIYINISR